MIALHHGGPHGHSASLLIALAEKGLDFADHRIDLAAFEQHGAAFLALNPDGMVPVLEADGHVLTETFFILLWLDERFPDPPLAGPDPKARYIAQKWGKYVETHLAPNLAIARWAVQGETPDATSHAGFARLTPERRALWERACTGFPDDQVTAARNAVQKAIDRVAEDLTPGPWLAGADYGLADIAVFPHIRRAATLGFPLPAPVIEWIDRMAARPAVQFILSSAESEKDVVTMGPELGRWG